MISDQKYDIRPIKSLKDMLEQSQRLFSNENAFLLKTKDGNYKGVSYSDYKDDVDALGTAFIDLGLKDKHIAVIGENRYEWCVSYLAVTNGTGVIVPLDKELPFSEIENLLIKSKASAVVYSEKFHDEMLKLSD